MVVTDLGISGVARLLIGSGNFPSHVAIGSGSGIAVASATGLFKEFDRNAFTTADGTTQKKVTWTTDFSSTEMSGNEITEFGLYNSGAGGDVFLYENLGIPVAFDGTNELRVEIVWTVF